MSLKKSTEHLLRDFNSRPTLRAGSLIITVFGDAISPRGGSVWIGSLIRSLAAFGISERLVRTSVFRHTRDDWLEATQIGRRSYYSLSNEGSRKFEQATLRIYGDPRQSWSGEWCLVLLADLPAEQKDVLRKELGWIGFAAISSDVLAHPATELPALRAALKRHDAERRPVVMQGSTLDERAGEAMRDLVHRRWNLEEIDARYGAFIARFRPVYAALQKSRNVDERLAFQIRTLLIQEYRRILLRDPLLPAELLPGGWNGTAAYQLCRNLYRRVYRAADVFMSSEFETVDGPLPPPAPEFYLRFGGLEQE